MMAPQSKLARIGFAGVGWIGRHRMVSAVRSGLVDAAVVCDASPEALEEAGRLVPKAKQVDNFDELLAMDLDGVVIATPNAYHAPQAMAALEAGLHTFCQKPLARTSAEAREVVQTAQRHDRLLGVDLSYRFLAGMQMIRDLVRIGDIGDVYAMDLVFHNAYGPDKPWFYERQFSGGGCLLDLGVHLVDAALWVLEFPEVERVDGRLYAKGKHLSGATAQTVEDYATARLDFATGATAQLACSWRLSAGCDAVISATFHGTTGSLQLRNVNGSFYDFIAERFRGTQRQTLAAPPEEWTGRAIIGWAQQVVRGARFDPESHQHVRVAEVLDRVYSG